ncbi:MAG: mechanosensitive ion channel protein MscS, partial [Flavobacteriales bacterium]
PVFVRFLNFGENGIELEVVFWAANSWDIINFKSDIRFEIDRQFRLHNIHIPYPTREIVQKQRD